MYHRTVKLSFKSLVSALLAVLLLAASVSTQTAPATRWPFSLLNPSDSNDDETRVVVRDVGPEFGINHSLEGFLINPQNPRQLLASSSANGISKSRDGGRTWFRSNNGLTDQQGLNANAFNIRKDHGHPLGVFAVTNGQGLYHSTDFGDTWTPIGDPWMSFALLQDCAINPASPNIVFALGSSEFFKSTDGGSTFVQQFGTGLPEFAHESMAIPPTNPDVIYVAVREESPFGGVYKSTDGGANFVHLDSSPSFALQVFPHPTLANTIYLQALGNGPTGLFRSTDGGETFLEVTAGLPPDGLNYFVAFDSANPSYVYVAGEGGVLRSTDGGSTFSALGLTQEQIGVSAITLTIDPTNSDLIYVNTTEGNFKSVNGGRRFVAINRGWRVSRVNFLTFDNHSRPNLYVSAPTGVAPWNATPVGRLVKTGNRGRHYDSIGENLPEVRSMAVGGNDSELIVIATDFDGIFRSIDGGQSWTAATLDTGQTVFAASRVAIDPTNPSNVYVAAGGFPGGFYRSVDGGQTFSRTNTTRVLPLAIDPLNPSVIYAAGLFSRTLLKSTNGGLGFTATQLGPSGSLIVDVILNPQDSRIVYVAGERLTASSNRKVVRSTDGGATFTSADDGLVGSVIGIAIDPLNPTRLFAWMLGGGLFMTEDSGNHWTLIAGGEAFRRSAFGARFNHIVAINPKKPNRIYLGGASVLEVTIKSGDDDEDDDN